MLRGLSPWTTAPAWPRMLMFCLVFGVIATTFATALAPQTAHAQEEGAAEEPAPEEAPAEETTEGDEAAAPVESFLGWMIRASGIWGLLILIMSFIMVALIVMNILQVRRDNFLPPAFIDAFEQRLAQKDYQGAYETAKADDSLVARVLAAGLSRLNRGYEEAIEGMQEVGEDENMTLEHRLSYLALIGTMGPMLGLAGTVWGMIASFRVIANSTTQPKPKDLADGIATALFTTIEGLAVAIPAIMFYSILRNRLSRFMLEVGMISEGLMSRFSTVGKKPSGGGAPQAAPAAKQE